MFQNFDDAIDFSQSAGRVARLRQILADGGIDGFVVPRADEHQGEYIPPSAARLAWLTGFTGSAGAALVLADRAAIFVDGRYTLQVRDQVDLAVFEPWNSVETPVHAFLKEHGAGLKIGIDPWLHTLSEVKQLREVLEAKGGALVLLPANPVDRIWNDRPAPPKGTVSRHSERYAGKPAAEKLAEIVAVLENEGADSVVLTDPSSIAWTFNIRGSDVSHTPLPLSFAVLHRAARPQLFIDPDKLDSETTAYLSGLAELLDPAAFEPALKRLAGTVMLDQGLAAARIGVGIVLDTRKSDNRGRLVGIAVRSFGNPFAVGFDRTASAQRMHEASCGKFVMAGAKECRQHAPATGIS